MRWVRHHGMRIGYRGPRVAPATTLLLLRKGLVPLGVPFHDLGDGWVVIDVEMDEPAFFALCNAE